MMQRYKKQLILAIGLLGISLAQIQSVHASSDDQVIFKQIPMQFIAALGAPMPSVEGCNKLDYAVLFVIAVAVDN